MATRIRLQRHGRKSYAFYSIVIADSRAPRDGKFIELLKLLKKLLLKHLQRKLQLRLKKLLQQKLLLNKFQQIPNKKSGKAINPLRSAGGDFFIVFCYKTYQIIYSVQNKMPFFASA